MTSGLFGIGGGALIVLGLLALGFGQHEAHATSLATMIVTALAALVPFALAGAVAVLPAVILSAGAAAGVFAGAGLMHRIPAGRLRTLFGVFILLVAVRMMVVAAAHPDQPPAGLDAGMSAGLAALGVGAGVLAGVLGVGGGLIIVPALVLAFSFSQHAAEGTSLAVVVPTALVGALRHGRRGYTRWSTGMVIGVAGIAGGVAGASVALAIDPAVLQRLFGAFLAVMALRLLIRRREPAAEP